MNTENIDIAAILAVFFIASCVFLTMTYIIYSVIKWYAKRREIRQYYNKPIDFRLWDRIGELN